MNKSFRKDEVEAGKRMWEQIQNAELTLMGETFSVQEIPECRTIHNSKSETFWWNCKKWKKAAYMNQHLHTLSWPILLLQKDFSLYITDWCRWWNTYSLVILQCDIFLPLIMSGKKKNPEVKKILKLVIELFWIQPISLEASFFKLKALIGNIIKAERFHFWDGK